MLRLAPREVTSVGVLTRDPPWVSIPLASRYHADEPKLKQYLTLLNSIKELTMQMPQPTCEHEWLFQWLGDWLFESECMMGPDQPPMQSSGTQTTRSLGSLWTVGELESLVPDGEPMRSIFTLGFDPVKKRFVGTFVSSCMTHLWPYDGQLDAARKTLTLDSWGPSFIDDGTMAKYQDLIEVISKDHYLLSSRLQNPDGSWTQFMNAKYTRVTKQG